MSRLVLFISLAAIFSSTGCSTVTLLKNQQSKTMANPTYEEEKKFYFWGLKDETHVYLDKICSGRSATQFVRQQEFVQGLLTAVTLGIYAPQTIKVWCE